jgi:hypothetical protein
MDDLTGKKGAAAIVVRNNNKLQVAAFKRLTATYGPVHSYRCVSSNSQYYFPFGARVSRTYDLHFAKHDATLALSMVPGLRPDDKIYHLAVVDCAPSEIRPKFVVMF